MHWKDMLESKEWVEGGLVHFRPTSYRHQTTVVMTHVGRQKTQFANGENNFGAYVELVRPDGSWISEGNNIVPVLPDGRVLMIVEQRPAQFRWGNKPAIIELEGRQVDLSIFGPYSSLEFPGGAVSAGESFRSSIVRELSEETGVGGQTATLYMRTHPVDAFGADLALRMYLGVIELRSSHFENRVENDGGLSVFALTRQEVQAAIWAGQITSGQAALLGWGFFNEYLDAVNEGAVEYLVAMGYITQKEVKLVK